MKNYFQRSVFLFCFLLSTTTWGLDAPSNATDSDAPQKGEKNEKLDFSAVNQDGKTIHLSDFSGKPVLVYFYPKDETPGCTQEACSFRDGFPKFKKLGAVVLGVSRQNEKSHQEFKKRHHLPFDLLVDTDGSIAKKLGVSEFPLIGLHRRQSVLIGADGKVAKFYGDVDPSKHADEVLADLEKLKTPTP